MTPAQIQTLIDACRTSPTDLVTWLELKAVLEGLKNQDLGLTLTTTGTSGPATLDIDTDILNIPNYSTDLTVYVPYTGANQNVNLGEYGIRSGWYQFDLTPTGTPVSASTMYWDDNQKTVALVMGGTTQKIGHDQFYHAKNSTGTTIPKGTAVRFAGTDGGSGHLLITPFLADGSNPSSYFMGVTSEEITNGSFGKVQSFGRLDGIDTSAFNEGDLLYCSTTVAGGFQTTVPQAPNNIILVAAVISDSNNGKILIRPTLGSKLSLDESVRISSPTNGQVLQYNSTLAVWQNATLSTSNVTEGTNLYYTDARARGAISLTTTGSGAATYNSSTGVLNIPTPSSVNLYNSDGTLTGNRTVTSGGFSLTFTGSNTASSGVARGLNLTHTLTAAANNDVLVGLDINPTFTNGAFTGVQNIALRVNGVTRTNGLTLNGNLFSFGNAIGEIVYENYPNNTSDVVFRVWNTTGVRSQFRATAAGGYTFAPNNGVQLTIHPNGNVGFGTGVDAGFRTDINGTARVQGQLTTGQIQFTANSQRLIVDANTFINLPGLGGNIGGIFGHGPNVGWSFRVNNSNTYAGIIAGNGTTTPNYFYVSEIAGFAPNILSIFFDLSKRSGTQATGESLLMIVPNLNQPAIGYAYKPSLIVAAGKSGTWTAADTYAPAGDLYLRGGDANNTGTNVNGGNIFIQSGLGTGTGTPGDVVFSTATATTTGTTLQTLTNRWWVKGGTGQLANVSTPDASAIFQLNSTTRGVLLPRMTTTQRNAIASPATGLIVYDTTTNSLDVYNGSAWLDILASDFLTIDNTNNRLGINTASPTYDLHVTGTAQITGNVLLAQSTATVGIGTITDSSYKLSVDGSIKSTLIRTSQPTGGVGVADWKLGSTATGTFTVDTGMCLQVEVGGTLYKVAIHT